MSTDLKDLSSEAWEVLRAAKHERELAIEFAVSVEVCPGSDGATPHYVCIDGEGERKFMSMGDAANLPLVDHFLYQGPTLLRIIETRQYPNICEFCTLTDPRFQPSGALDFTSTRRVKRGLYMTKETRDIIHYVLTSENPVGRWTAARAVGASPRNARNIFSRMRCLVPAGVRLRNGTSEPEQLSRVDRDQTPLYCSECVYAKGACDPKWRDTTAPLGFDVAPPEDEAA